MSPSRPAIYTLALVATTVAALTQHTASAQSYDKTSAALAGAREAYEAALNSVRADIDRALKSALENAAKAKDPTDAVKKARDDAQNFESRGQLPDRDQARWEQRYAKPADALRKEYARAVAAYAAQKKPDLADAVSAESDRFATHWDLVPWKPDLVNGKAAAERTLRPGASLTVDPGLKGQYRLEIKARRTSDSGSLFVDLPLADSKQLTVPALNTDKGDLHVLLTVQDGLVSPDAGVARPIDTRNATPGDGHRITLRADGGSVVVDVLRVKPIIEGKPPDVQDAPRKTTGERPPNNDPSAQLIQGSKWAGKRTIHGDGHEQDCVVTVGRRNGETVVVRTPSWGGDGTLIISLTVNGGSLSVDGLRYEGRNPRSFSNVAGNGSIAGDTLSFSYTCRVSIGKTTGQPDSSTFRLQRQ